MSLCFLWKRVKEQKVAFLQYYLQDLQGILKQHCHVCKKEIIYGWCPLVGIDCYMMDRQTCCGIIAISTPTTKLLLSLSSPSKLSLHEHMCTQYINVLSMKTGKHNWEEKNLECTHKDFICIFCSYPIEELSHTKIVAGFAQSDGFHCKIFHKHCLPTLPSLPFSC